ncbi:MAG: Lrp/AsnC ligand binding domain-containing protein [Candidatus Bathyarchaeota archaeon]|nr:Lrp/AsnC ligand binding domain-containing protein [Candidatus Bathyarchaeota archaeon]
MSVLAYVLVTLNPGTEKDILKKISRLNEVTRVSMMYGDYDAIIKVCTGNLEQLNHFLTDKLRVLPDIFQTATLIVAKTHSSKR